MGQQQLLLIILGVIIVGIAIAVGLSMFSAQSISSNKDAMINDLNNIFANAYQYKIRPGSMGGGNGKYAGYQIPATLSVNENGFYRALTVTDTTVAFEGKSAQDSSKRVIKVTIGPDGRPIATTWSYEGDFK
jgi:hypothetical protein